MSRYYYWDNNFKNQLGEDLETCKAKYGLGKQNLNKNVRYEVIFLDANKDFGNSWMLKMFNRQTGDNVEVTAYKDNKVYLN